MSMDFKMIEPRRPKTIVVKSTFKLLDDEHDPLNPDNLPVFEPGGYCERCKATHGPRWPSFEMILFLALAAQDIGDEIDRRLVETIAGRRLP